MPSEKDFEYAVQLAAAFVANGDVRLPEGSIRPERLHRLADLIDSLHSVVETARKLCDDRLALASQLPAPPAGSAPH